MLQLFGRILILMTFSALLMQCSNQENQTVARVGDQVIKVAELRQRLAEVYPDKQIGELSLEEKQKVLDEMLDQRRKFILAGKKGLDKDPEYVRARDQYADRLIAIALYRGIIVDKLLPETLLRQYYDWKQFQINAVLIRVGHQEANLYDQKRTVEEARKLAEQYREGLEKSSDPEEYAKSVSDDSRNRPLLHPFPIGRFSYPVDSLVFNAQPGEVVGPVDTHRGFVILKVLSREHLPGALSFEDEKEDIRRAIRGYFVQKEKEFFEQYSAMFREKHHVEINEENIRQFHKLLFQWGENPQRRLTDFTEEQKQMAFADINGVPFTAAELLNTFGARLYKDFRKFATPEDLKMGFVIPQINITAWAMEGKARGIDRQASIQRDVFQFTLTRLGQVLEKIEVDDQISVGEQEIAEYYAANRQQFTEPEKIKIWQIPVENEKTAAEVLQKARRGDSMKDLSRKYRKKGTTERFDLGLQPRTSRYKEVVAAAFKAGANQVAGPVLSNGTYFVIKTGEYQAARPKSLEEVRDIIQTRLTDELKRRKRVELLEKIRQEYAYRINESILRRVS